MKRLLLLRHAKSLPGSPLGDHARTLNQRGTSDAQRMGHYLVEEALLPDQILVSDARRTRETLDGLRAALNARLGVQIESALYHASMELLLEFTQKTHGNCTTLLIIGHNPGLAELALALTGFGDRYALVRMRAKYPTCGLCVLDFDVPTWADVATAGGRLERFITPVVWGGQADD